MKFGIAINCQKKIAKKISRKDIKVHVCNLFSKTTLCGKKIQNNGNWTRKKSVDEKYDKICCEFCQKIWKKIPLKIKKDSFR